MSGLTVQIQCQYAHPLQCTKMCTLHNSSNPLFLAYDCNRRFINFSIWQAQYSISLFAAVSKFRSLGRLKYYGRIVSIIWTWAGVGSCCAGFDMGGISYLWSICCNYIGIIGPITRDPGALTSCLIICQTGTS